MHFHIYTSRLDPPPPGKIFWIRAWSIFLQAFHLISRSKLRHLVEGDFNRPFIYPFFWQPTLTAFFHSSILAIVHECPCRALYGNGANNSLHSLKENLWINADLKAENGRLKTLLHCISVIISSLQDLADVVIGKLEVITVLFTCLITLFVLSQ